ncbi:MAG: TULIP family P47-like protein [Bacteroidota bacterium]
MSTLDTYGWDAVVATRISAINKKLPAVSTPFSETVDASPAKVHVTGELGTWQIASGGSGRLIHFTVPCSKIKLDNGSKSVEFQKGHFTIEASLYWELIEGQATQQQLKIKADPEVRVLGAMFPESNFEEFATYAIAGVQAWVKQQEQYPYAFASVTLSEDQAGSSLAWTPAEVDYAYTDTPDTEGVLAVLCKVAGSQQPNHQLAEVSPEAVPAGQVSAILLHHTLLAAQLTPLVSAVGWPGHPQSQVQVTRELSFPIQINPS